MAHKDSPFGFWIPVTDRPSAEYAAKMSGLPVFLMGLSFIIMAVFQLFLSRAQPIVIISAILILGGAILMYLGLQIRNLKFGVLPFSIGIWFVLNLLGIASGGFGYSTILTLLIGILAISGLRGWLWLKRHPFDKEVF